MGASVVLHVDVAVEERGWSDSRNSLMDSRVRALGRVTMVSERLAIDGSAVIDVVVEFVCKMVVGQSAVEVCASAIVAAVTAVSTPVSTVQEEESATENPAPCPFP
jgi:hypothetical protein